MLSASKSFSATLTRAIQHSHRESLTLEVISLQLIQQVYLSYAEEKNPVDFLVLLPRVEYYYLNL